MGLRVKTAPANDAVDVAEVVSQLGVLPESESHILTLIRAAQASAETYLGRALITQTLVLTLDCFPWCIRLPRPPLQSVDSIKYIDGSTGVLTTIDSASYRVTTGEEPARVEPTYGESWPTPQPVVEAVEIEFTAGYGATAASVPANIQQAITLMVGEWFQYREGMCSGERPIPHNAKWLLDKDRIGGLFACRGLTQ